MSNNAPLANNATNEQARRTQRTDSRYPLRAPGPLLEEVNTDRQCRTPVSEYEP